MKTTYTYETELDSIDLHDDMNLTVIAEIDYDSYTKRRSVEVKSVSMMVKDKDGKEQDISVHLDHFNEGIIGIWEKAIADKYDQALIDDDREGRSA